MSCLALLLAALMSCAHRAPGPVSETPAEEAAAEAHLAGLLEAAKVDDAIAYTQDYLGRHPQNVHARFLLVQLLIAVEQYDEARSWLGPLIEREPEGAEWVASMIRAEQVRHWVLAGVNQVDNGSRGDDWWHVFGRAPQGLADPDARQATTDAVLAAWEEVPRRSGTLDGLRFVELRDADDLLGPGLELLVRDGYEQAPFHRVSRIDFQPRTNPFEEIWLPTVITGDDGHTQFGGWVPACYAGSGTMGGDAALGQVTFQLGPEGSLRRGFGQRDLAVTFEGRDGVTLVGIREIQSIVFDP